MTSTCGVIFDLDGTLIDSIGGIAAAVNRMLIAEGLAEMTSAEVQAFVGSGLPALEALDAAGHPLALCTNKPLRPTHAALESTGLRRFFRAVVGGDTLPVRKPDPAPLLTAWRALGTTRAIYVGDSGVDAQTAEAAALPFVLFTEGYLNAPRETIRETASFSDFGALPGLISRISATS